jgi:ammonium transporter, Amt family
VGQFASQLIGAAVVMVWAFGCGYVLFKVLDKVLGVRVDPHEELQGLDIIEHGTPGYPEFYIPRI